MLSNNTIDRTVSLSISFKKITLLIACLYVIIATSFEWSEGPLAKLASILLYLSTACCVFEALKTMKFKVWRYSKTFLIFAIILSISYIYSPAQPLIKWTYYYRFISSLVFLILFSPIISNKRDFDFFLTGVVIAGPVLAIRLYMFYGLNNLMQALSRFDNELGNQNTLAMHMSFSVIISIYYLFIEKRKDIFGLIIYSLSIIICIPAILFSGSRKAVLIIVVSTMIMFLTISRKKKTMERYITLWSTRNR